MPPGTPQETPASELAAAIKRARQELGITQAELARRARITPSYVSRLESAAWQSGGPWPSHDVLRALARELRCSSTRLVDLRDAEREQADGASRGRGWSRRIDSVRYGVSVGDEAVDQAARRLLDRNPSRGTVRLTSQFFERRQLPVTLGQRLAEDTAAILYRVCVASSGDVDGIRSSTQRLAVGRDPTTIQNIRTRCCFAPPAMFDVLVGENEALIAVPDRRGHPFLRTCIVVDDPDLVSALKDWYDDYIWEPTGGYVDLKYDRLEEGLERVRQRLTG